MLNPGSVLRVSVRSSGSTPFSGPCLVRQQVIVMIIGLLAWSLVYRNPMACTTEKPANNDSKKLRTLDLALTDDTGTIYTGIISYNHCCSISQR